MPEQIRILSFNVNGLKAALQRLYEKKASIRTFLEDVGKDSDIVCLQETKLTKNELLFYAHDLAEADGWESFFSCAQTGRGYSGTATFVRRGRCIPFSAELGFTRVNMEEDPPTTACPELLLASGLGSLGELVRLDSEGRVVVTDHDKFILYNVYGPAITSEDSSKASERMDFKMQFFNALLQRWKYDAEQLGKTIVVVGDLNIAPAPIDCPDEGKDFFRESRPDRMWMQSLLSEHGFADCFRCFHPDRRNAYTVWSQVTGARANNYGSRIDLCLVSRCMMQDISPMSGKSECRVVYSDICPHVPGSDHCPVYLDIEYTGPGAFPCSKTVPKVSIKYMITGKQKKISCFLQKGTAPEACNNGASAKRSGDRPYPFQKPKQMKLKSFFNGSGNLKLTNTDIHTTGDASSSLWGNSGSPSTTGYADDEDREKKRQEAKLTWMKIQSKMQAPNCRHGIPSIIKRVNKKGPTKGRHFYTCSKNEGDPKSPESKCNFFQWVTKQ